MVSEIARIATLQVAARRCTAKTYFHDQKNDFVERSRFFQKKFREKLIRAILIRCTCKFNFRLNNREMG